MDPKPPSDQPAIRIIMLPRDTNSEGSIFGGVILSLIDQASAVEAVRQSRRRYVTKAMDTVEFHEPVRVGDLVTLWAKTVRIGRTSICVHVEVDAQARASDTGRKVTEADVTLVAVDDEGQPIPVLEA
jgi:acyl-CoA thioesterase YciA